MDKGYIKIHRKITESPLWQYAVSMKMPHLIGAFILLLLAVNYEEKQWYDGKSEVTIPPGSMITSLENLSEIMGLSFQQTRTTLSHFEKMGMITRRTTNKWTQVWIVNWGKYQHDSSSDNKQDNKQSNNQQTDNMKYNKQIQARTQAQSSSVDNNEITTTKEYICNSPHVVGENYLNSDKDNISIRGAKPAPPPRAFKKTVVPPALSDWTELEKWAGLDAESRAKKANDDWDRKAARELGMTLEQFRKAMGFT